MNKVYYLSTCDTCKRIMKDVGMESNFEKQDIKVQPLSELQIDALFEVVGSYEALINKRARKFKGAVLENPIAEDKDYRKLLTMDYTFLKRPVFVLDGKVFAGNAKKTVEEVREVLQG